jgi:hypothetical protein
MREVVPHEEQESLEPHGKCGAKTRSGDSCKSISMLNGRCRMHGGTSPKGRKHPRWKHGNYSQYPDGFLMRLYYETKTT